MEVIRLKYKPLRMDENFQEFCTQNDMLKVERDSEGTIHILPCSGGITGMLNAMINYWLMHWHREANMGHVFDSSTTFRLPNTSIRSPKASWISNEKWERLTEDEQTNFPPLCPDFVIELMSDTDDLKTMQEKMREEWVGNGCKLAWLIEPSSELVYVYRPNADVQVISGFNHSLSGENVLEGFEFDLSKLKNIVV